MKKKLLSIAFALSIAVCMIALPGCSTENCHNCSDTTFTVPFNEEQYVWQDFMFPTNRTSGRQ